MIVVTRHESAYLADNMLGDPGERDLFVYLPPDYEESDRHYATAYLLHAFGEGAKDVVNPPTDGERWRPPIEDVLDPVFRRMEVPPMIVVIPDGNSRWGCGQWVDSPVSVNRLRDVATHLDHLGLIFRAPRTCHGVLPFV